MIGAINSPVLRQSFVRTFCDPLRRREPALNLRSVDLNLLVVLDALLNECNVSRAGERVGLSQPAMSAAPARLREIFRDPLLVRVGRDLALTRNAEELIVPLREALDRIEMTLRQKARFDPRVDVRTFSISASDYAGFVLLAPFVRAVASEAPNVSIHLLPRSRDAARVLQSNQADLVIEPSELFGESEFPSSPLISDRWLCAVDADNPLTPDGKITKSNSCVFRIWSMASDRTDSSISRISIWRRLASSDEST